MLIIIAAIILLGLILAPMGCFVLWKKYSYYGDGLAHATMLAVIFSVITDCNLVLAAFFNSVLFVALVYCSGYKAENNAVIGLVSSSMMSIALILSSLYPMQVNLEQLLFGNLVLVNLQDIYQLLMIFALVAAFLLTHYQKLIVTILSKEIAHLQNIKVQIVELLFLLILSFTIISTIKIVGALLVVSILLIPAMIARIFAKTPLQMIFLAVIIIQLMNIFGVLASFYWDLAFAPSIVLGGGVAYFILVGGKALIANIR